jgi:hypothetical protein
LVLYAVSFSLLGFDLVMGLDGTWHSSLFGAYFFLSNFYLGVGALAILALGASRSHQVGTPITRGQLADLAKLLFTLSLLVGYFVWSQYLVIWYGNIPAETAYIALRLLTPPWAALAWGLLVLLFLIPFVSLLSRRAKASPPVVGSVAILIMVGMWLERYMLVIPSLHPAQGLRLSWQDLAITAGFLAALILTYSLFWQRALPLTSASH